MSRVRVLVGTRKGAFVLTADGTRDRWDVSGPHFGGWEIYHLKGAPADPDRLDARGEHREDEDLARQVHQEFTCDPRKDRQQE